MNSNLVEVEEVTEEELPNNQQQAVNHVQEGSDDEEELCYVHTTDAELESLGKVRVFHLNLDPCRTMQGSKEERVFHKR